MARIGTVFYSQLCSIAVEHSVRSPGVWKICDLVLLFVLIFISDYQGWKITDNQGWKIPETTWL